MSVNVRSKSWAVLVCLSLCASCATSGELDRTRTALEARLTALETNDQQRRRQLQEAVEQATSQVRTLTAQLEQARTQTRNLADLGARLESIEERLRTLNGTIEDMRHILDEANASRTQVATRVEAVERRLGLAPLVDPSQIPADNAQVLAQARQAFEGRDYPRARFLANALLQRAPQDPNADDALLLQARAQLAESRAATAVQDLNRLLQNYPSGDAVPEALAVLADAFVNLRMCVQAQRTLRLLIERHGSTASGRNARTRLEAVRALPREACSG